MFESLLGKTPPRRVRQQEDLGGHELMMHAVSTGERGVLLLGEPLQVVPAILRDLADHRMVILAPGLEFTPAEGHLCLLRVVVLGRSVACHGRVTGVTPSGNGLLLRVTLAEPYLVMQARRAFRIPARGLEIRFELLDVDQKILLQDVSLQGAGVVVEGKPLAAASIVRVRLGHGDRSLELPAQVVGHHGHVTGLLLQPADDQVTELRRTIMEIERAWIARERRIGH